MIRRRTSICGFFVVTLLTTSALAEVVGPRLPPLVDWSQAAPWAHDAFDRQREEAPMVSTPPPAGRDDGVYGRFDGTVSFSPGLGVEASQEGLGGTLGLRAFVLHTVGVSGQYRDGRLMPFGKSTDYRGGVIAIELRPLFLLRWSKDWEQGPSWLDLTLDSLTLGVGGYSDQRAKGDLLEQGVYSSLSFGFPLLGRALGPWLCLEGNQRWGSAVVSSLPARLGGLLRLEWTFGTDERVSERSR